MRKLFPLLAFAAALAVTSCRHTQPTGKGSGTDSIVIDTTHYADIKALQANWDKQPITVEQSTPDIIDLVAAFHAVWPLPATQNILSAVAQGDSLVDLVSEDYIIHIDRAKGYAYQEMLNVMSDDFKALAFGRDNGSQLLLIQWCAPKGEPVMCVYDYSPRSRTLKAYGNLLEGITPAHPGETLAFRFPDDPATQLPGVSEYYGKWRYHIVQDLVWDGHRFIPQPLAPDWLNGIYKMVELRDPDTTFNRYAIVTLGGDIYMLLTDADDVCQAMFFQPENEAYTLVASNQGYGELHLFANGVIQKVACGDSCATEDYILCSSGKHERILSVYTLRDPDGNILEQTFSVGTKELSREEGRKLMQKAQQQLGSAIDNNINWQNIG